MLPVEGSRVVTISSHGHRMLARIHFDDLQWERSYNRFARLRAVQAGQPAVHLRAGAPAGRQGRADHRGRRPPRRLQHRTHPQSAGIDSPGRRVPVGAGHPERRDGRAADAAGRDRPRRAKRPVLRPRRASANSAATRNSLQSNAQSHDEQLQRRLWTRLRGVDRRHLPGLVMHALRRRAPPRRRRPDHTATAGHPAPRRRARPGARRRCGGAAVAARLRQLRDGRVRRRRRRRRRGDPREPGAAARRRGHPGRAHRHARP